MTARLQNLEVEQALLGAVLTDNSNLAHVGSLGPQHFAEPLHARLFEAAAIMIRAGKLASMITLKMAFDSDTTLREIGGTKYLAQLAAVAGPSIGVQTYAAAIRDLADRRAAIIVSNELAARATEVAGNNFRQDLAGGIARLEHLFDGARERKTQFGLDEAAAGSLARLDQRSSGTADPNTISTGFRSLDDMIGGFRRGEYIVIGARPSVGKTAVGVQIAANTARAGLGVVYFSLEMPVALITPRFLSSHVSGSGGPQIAYQRLLHGDVSPEETKSLRSAADTFKAWSLTIDDDAGLTTTEVEARCRVIASHLTAKGKSLDLIVIDHIHKMRHPGSHSRVAEYSEISAGLAEAAKRLNCPLVALAQLNRAVEGRDDKRPCLADLRESGAIEQDADTVAFLYRSAYYLDRQRCREPQAEANRLRDLDADGNHLEFIIAKQRSGPIGTVDLWCDMATNVVKDSMEFMTSGKPHDHPA